MYGSILHVFPAGYRLRICMMPQREGRRVLREELAPRGWAAAQVLLKAEEGKVRSQKGDSPTTCLTNERL